MITTHLFFPCCYNHIISLYFIVFHIVVYVHLHSFQWPNITATTMWTKLLGYNRESFWLWLNRFPQLFVIAEVTHSNTHGTDGSQVSPIRCSTPGKREGPRDPRLRDSIQVETSCNMSVRKSFRRRGFQTLHFIVFFTSIHLFWNSVSAIVQSRMTQVCSS